MTRKILVIEDQENHIDDAMDFFNPEFCKVEGLEISYAKCYLETIQDRPDGYKMFTKLYDEENGRSIKSKGDFNGVISDVYFPLGNDGRWGKYTDPIGLRIALELEEAGVPFVLNTSLSHHGIRFEWMNGIRNDRGWILIENARTIDEDAPKKNWESAYQKLKEFMDKKECG